MIWCFTSLLTLFKSNHNDGRAIMKGSMQWSTVSHEPPTGFEPETSWSIVRSANHSAHPHPSPQYEHYISIVEKIFSALLSDIHTEDPEHFFWLFFFSPKSANHTFNSFFFSFFFSVRENKTCQMIHMKNQVLFSLNKKYNVVCYKSAYCFKG